MSEVDANEEFLKQVPPHYLDAEKNLLGILMLQGSMLADLLESTGKFDPDDFFSQKNRIIFEAILRRAERGSEDFTPTLICTDLEQSGKLAKAGGEAYVHSLTDVSASVYSINELAEKIKNSAQRRRLIKVADHIKNLGLSPEGRSNTDIYDEAMGMLFNLAESTHSENSGPQGITATTIEAIKDIKERAASDNKMRGVPTQFHELDELISGLQGGTLNIIAARPGIGKTSFAMNIVENIAMNPDIKAPALVFSLEMPAKQIVMRMLSTFGRVNLGKLTEGTVQTAQWADIISKLRLLIAYNDDGSQHDKIFIDDSGEVTPIDIRTRARKLYEENGGLSVIMVDYIQLMKSQNNRENRTLEVAEITRSLKLLAKELDVPIIALSQLNREVEGRKDHRPMNSDLRESGSIEQDADLIMFLHRESVYKPKSDGSSDDGKALLIVSKNRSGATKDIELQFQGAYTAFYDARSNLGELADIPPAAE